MKKIFISVIALALSVMAMATETAYVQVRLTGASGGSNSVYLTEDDAYTAAYESGVDTEKMMSLSNSKSVLMYGLVGATFCEDVVQDNLDGLYLGFTTNQVDADYTLTFVNHEGRELSLFDAVTGVTTTINASTPAYHFSVEASQVGRVQVLDRFIIGGTAYKVVTNEDGFASYSAAADLAVPAGLVAYKGAYNAASEELALTALANGIPANQGVFVKGAANTTYFFTAATATSDMSGNELVACVSRTDVSGVAEQVFCLRNVGGVSGLYQYTGQYVPAGKAYLPIATAAAPAPGRRVSIRVEAPTAVEAVAAEGKAEKVVRDGQLLILRDGKTYNVQGQLVK